MMPLWTTATLLVGVQVRVGVLVAGGAVGGPAGVGDAGGARRTRLGTRASSSRTRPLALTIFSAAAAPVMTMPAES